MSALDEAITALDPHEAQRLARQHARALTIAHNRHQLRLWTCPICWTSQTSRVAPDGWLVVEPFTRVAACATCRRELEARHA